MAEIINYYDLNGNLVGEGDRKKILKEQEIISRRTLSTTKVNTILDGSDEISPENFAVESVMMFLFDKNNNIYIVQRSQDKAENPGLWDKSAGGHVVKGDTFDSTAKKELSEELGVDSIVAKDQDDFFRILNNEDIDKKAILLGVQSLRNYISKRTTPENDTWYKLFNSKLYIGMYNGNVVFSDGEAVGKKVISIDDLEKEIQNNPELYTYDILRLIQQYKVLDSIKNISKIVVDILK